MSTTPLHRRSPLDVAAELGLTVRTFGFNELVTCESETSMPPVLLVFAGNAAFAALAVLHRGEPGSPAFRCIFAVPPSYAALGEGVVLAERSLPAIVPGEEDVTDAPCTVLFLDVTPSILSNTLQLVVFPETFDGLHMFHDGMDDVLPAVYGLLQAAREEFLDESGELYGAYLTADDEFEEEAFLAGAAAAARAPAAPGPPAAAVAGRRAHFAPLPSVAPASANATRGRGGRTGAAAKATARRTPTGNAAVLEEVAALRAEIARLRSAGGVPSPLGDGVDSGAAGAARHAPLPPRGSERDYGAGRSDPLGHALARARTSLGEAASPPAAEPTGRRSARSDQALEDLLRQASQGSDGGSERAMQLAQTLLLDRVSQRLNGGGRRGGDADDDDERSDDMFNLGDELDASGAGVSLRGSEGIGRVHQNIRRFPERWCRAFDRSIEESSFSHVTGLPWSLHAYTRENLRFNEQQRDLENCTYIFSALHAVHRRGPDAHWQLGAMLAQAYKAVEQASRDRDWTLAWLWTGLPHPRPQGRFQRGLAHPAEHAAGLSYLRELRTLQQHREEVSGGASHNGFGPYRPTGGGGGGGGGGGSGGGGGGGANTAKGDTKGGKGGGGGGGRGPHGGGKGGVGGGNGGADGAAPAEGAEGATAAEGGEGDQGNRGGRRRGRGARGTPP